MASEPDWHGWSICDAHGARSLHVGTLPGRGRVALYTISPLNKIVPLAYFSSVTAAQEALDMIDQLARVGRYEQERSDGR